jgi:hypothetical protein
MIVDELLNGLKREWTDAEQNLIAKTFVQLIVENRKLKSIIDNLNSATAIAETKGEVK